MVIDGLERAVRDLDGPTASLRAAMGGVAEGPSPHLESLGLVLTTACNLNCSYCYQERAAPRAIPWEVASKALDLLASVGHRRPAVTLFGGEPLLEFGLLQRAIRHAETGWEGPVRPSFRVTTNGTLLSEDILDFFEDHAVATTVSFDGVPAAQRLRGPETFETVDQILSRLTRQRQEYASGKLEVRITVSSANLPHLTRSVRYLVSGGIRTISLSPVVTHDSGWSPEMTDLLHRQLEAVADVCAAAIRGGELVPVSNLRRPRTVRSRRRKDLPMCGATRGRRVVVDVDGSCYGCSLFIGSVQRSPRGLLADCARVMNLGHLESIRAARGRTKLAREIRSVRPFFNKESKRSSVGRCRDCGFLTECVVCPAAIGYAEANLDADFIPELQCAFNRAVLQARHRLWAEAGDPAAGSDSRRDRSSA
jgi:sulfatase maturation enzyme AslB (radical SAM superfamily)